MLKRLLLISVALAPAAAWAQSAGAPAAPAVPAGQSAPAAAPMDPAKAQAAIAKAPAIFFQLLAPNMKVEQIVARMDGIAQRFDMNHDGTLDGADVKAMEDGQLVRMRAAKVQQILNYDVRNVGKVTRADVESVVRRESGPNIPAAVLQGRVDQVMKADLNHDGTIDFEEMRTLSPDEQRAQSKTPVEQFLSESKDGKSITVQELRDAFAEFVRAVDADGDGTVSQAELQAVEPQMRAAMAAMRPAAPAAPVAATAQPRPAPAPKAGAPVKAAPAH